MRLNRDELLELFAYDPRGFLISKVQRGLWNPGKKIGQVGRKGYLITRFDDKVHLLHRVIWTMFHGHIPEGMFIDHMNGDVADNRIENLRLVTATQNQRNQRRGRRNKSGVTGVYWCNTFKRWKAFMRINGQTRSKTYRSFDEAVAARKQLERFYGYHPNHGRVVQSTLDVTDGGKNVELRQL